MPSAICQVNEKERLLDIIRLIKAQLSFLIQKIEQAVDELEEELRLQ